MTWKVGPVQEIQADGRSAPTHGFTIQDERGSPFSHLVMAAHKKQRTLGPPLSGVSKTRCF